MSEALRLLFAGYCIVAITTPSAAADAGHGKEIATRWCASVRTALVRVSSNNVR
jgi:hypothetical protein